MAVTDEHKANRFDAAKGDLLERAAAVGDDGPFIRRYYRHVAAEDLLGRDPAHVRDDAVAHRELAQSRPQGTALVRVSTPPAVGAILAPTVVEVVTDDMPFLVDSVTIELERRGIDIQLVIHPQLVVRRDLNGALLEVLPEVDADEVPAGAHVESWIRLEIDREASEECEAIRADLLSVLRDVRESVEDWPRMRAAALGIAAELTSTPPALPADEVAQGRELLSWLVDDHFTFLGYREYRLVDAGDGDALAAVPGTGLGILRPDKPLSASFAKLPEEARARARQANLLIITKANSRSTVHRSAYLDYLGIKTFDADGNVTGERRFLGLFTSTAYSESIMRIPVLRDKAVSVLAMSGFTANSHGGKDLLRVLEDYPRDDMFQISTADLYEIAMGVLHLQERRRLRLFMRRDDYGRFLSCLVYLPRDRYNTRARLRMQSILLETLGGTNIDYTLSVTESVLARLHFVVRVDAHEEREVDIAALERRLVAVTRSWDDDLAELLLDIYGEERASALLKVYGDAFPEAYKEDFEVARAVDAIARLEALGTSEALGLDLYTPDGAEPGVRHMTIYRLSSPMSLSDVLPLLSRMGVEVTDERPYQLDRTNATRAWIYDFGLRYDADAVQADPDAVKALFEDAFAATWRGDAQSDGFNALVLRAGLSWREVVVLRAYAKFLRQMGSTFSQDYIEATVNAQVPIARLLVRLFAERFDPAGGSDAQVRAARVDAVTEQITQLLDGVSSLDQDRILRGLLELVRATLRTNFWQRDSAGAPKPYLSLKFASEQIADMPLPRPKFEIFVYSPRVEGVHLRFGMVARGGLRWSDRFEDYRTEVLGLVKTQMVKNAVIVPVGSKGGFVVKRPPAETEALGAEVVACYQDFIRGLLDLTDNLIDGKVVPPADVVRHDGDDTYLVVAADKGTARFSDTANAISADYGYWLGDAFASGGSAGYDHKGMGITARGAWESVKSHFRELGVDCQRSDFTCVGVGDMSGDVFGNGMLCSEHIRLLAAFDHRHIFLDPNPEAAASFAERQRLFDLPRSSWADYDAALISEGGGVFPRTLKKVPLSPQVQQALGVDADYLTPNELIKAILGAPVDLLWNGGIGTYVKASTETHAQVGDRAGDATRIDGRDLRCRIVGEGGNLGFTQLGRVEYARSGGPDGTGGLNNTDAIDNSAGVDTSDHEVNIKILLGTAVRSGEMRLEERNDTLAQMTDEVAELVLATNYDQNVALSLSLAQAPGMLHVHDAYMNSLEKAGQLNREVEFLPSSKEIAARRQAGVGLMRPELSVLLAYAKITLSEELLDSDLPEDPFLQRELVGYFPTLLRERFAAAMEQHPLRREIVVTKVVNRMVNEVGTSFAFRLAGDTTAAPADIARAYTIANVVFGLEAYRRSVEALDNVVPSALQVDLLLEARRLAERGSRWLLNNRRTPIEIQGTIDFFAGGVAQVAAVLPELLRGSDAEYRRGREESLRAAGVPAEVARQAAAMSALYAALSIVDVSVISARPVEEVAAVHFDLADRLRLSAVRNLVVELPRDNRWHTMARAALRDDLYAAHSELVADVLLSTDASLPLEDRIAAWTQANAAAVNRTHAMLDELVVGGTPDLATLSVAMREIRALVKAASLPGA